MVAAAESYDSVPTDVGFELCPVMYFVVPDGLCVRVGCNSTRKRNGVVSAFHYNSYVIGHSATRNCAFRDRTLLIKYSCK